MGIAATSDIFGAGVGSHMAQNFSLGLWEKIKVSFL